MEQPLPAADRKAWEQHPMLMKHTNTHKKGMVQDDRVYTGSERKIR